MHRLIHRHPDMNRAYAGYILMEFIIGLILVMFMLGMIVTVQGKMKDSERVMASRRQAVYLAESQLAQMQIPGQNIKFTPDTQIQVLKEQPSDKRFVWINMTVKHQGHQTTLVGLVYRTYLGDLP
tara:strand:+ start:415 stop:789 length:375 start_codon:yes stop_codon:yes gene_type:complete